MLWENLNRQVKVDGRGLQSFNPRLLNEDLDTKIGARTCDMETRSAWYKLCEEDMLCS